MKLSRIILAGLVFSACACSGGNENEASGEHVWKEQVGTIDKAKEVEATLLKSAEDKARSISEQTQ